MGKTDVRESDYLEDAEIFADLVNGILYKGEQVVKPQDLREQDGELRSAAGNDVKKVIRDKVRLWKGTVFAVFSVENQTRVDYRMVTRAGNSIERSERIKEMSIESKSIFWKVRDGR